MSDPKQQFEKLSLEFSNQQTTLNDLISSRSKLETQFQENKIVMEELNLLNDESKIFKLTGPILMPQDYSEAKLNVSKRIEFIEDEISRVEKKIEDNQKSIEKTRDTILELRSNMNK
ncbi:uncharacterized protein PRCAT00001095001 [Priceomyces carsonii]|uniref:uncharacterized protein n=1 Tax=Priceomyces carsonii TaxID=28549 RepID=UPI002ED7B6FB|nr:unnamed protein product [Priceomyces carsonii]